jgi:hypothetical protein
MDHRTGISASRFGTVGVKTRKMISLIFSEPSKKAALKAAFFLRGFGCQEIESLNPETRTPTPETFCFLQHGGTKSR